MYFLIGLDFCFPLRTVLVLCSVKFVDSGEFKILEDSTHNDSVHDEI